MILKFVRRNALCIGFNFTFLWPRLVYVYIHMNVIDLQLPDLFSIYICA